MKYQYTSEGFENDLYNKKNQFQLNGVNFLILFNVVIYLLVGPNNLFIHYLFGVSSNNFEIWQLFTYMFLHGGLMHLFFNMFLLWMFGRTIESVWGTYKFLKYYFLTGIGSGLCIYLFGQATTIGASGAVMAVLFAYGYLYPNRMLLFYFVPMKAKYCILILILMELSQELLRNDNISHVGHLGGMFFGYIYLKFGDKLFGNKFSFIKIKKVPKDKKGHPASDINNIDEILDKLKLEGWDGLTENEKSRLFQASKDRKNNHHIN